MRFNNKIRNVELEISDDLIDQFELLGREHYPNEFGGFLIGTYTSDSRILSITDMILPKQYEGLPYSFYRSSEGTEKTLKEFYEQEPRKYYVGEWHTHPNGTTTYSQTDLNAMISIEQCPTVKINNPILLIISIKKDSPLEFDFYLYEKNKLSKYGKIN